MAGSQQVEDSIRVPCVLTTGLAHGWYCPRTVGGSVGASGTAAVALLDVLQACEIAYHETCMLKTSMKHV